MPDSFRHPTRRKEQCSRRVGPRNTSGVTTARCGTAGHPDHIGRMTTLGDWIEHYAHGIYVAPADAWIDHSIPSPRALVTHGHADHAMGGQGAGWATPGPLALMEPTLGPQSGQPATSGAPVYSQRVWDARRGGVVR